MAHALTSSAERFRPALVYMVADALGNGSDVSESALAVEYFHTASLIADDLPCMDNDDFRRGKPTTHKVYGEAVALLASFALISAGFEQIANNCKKLQNKATAADISQLAVRHASLCTGSVGLIGGQFLDLFTKDLDESKMFEIIQKKTAALFDLSFSLGWLFGGGSVEKLKTVQDAAFHFGAAFQIIDDIDDMQKDKDAKNPVNYANLFGLEKAVDTVRESLEKFHETMKSLHVASKPLNELASCLQQFL